MKKEEFKENLSKYFDSKEFKDNITKFSDIILDKDNIIDIQSVNKNVVLSDEKMLAFLKAAILTLVVEKIASVETSEDEKILIELMLDQVEVIVDNLNK
jgi:hypothetical protein